MGIESCDGMELGFRFWPGFLGRRRYVARAVSTWARACRHNSRRARARAAVSFQRTAQRFGNARTNRPRFLDGAGEVGTKAAACGGDATPVCPHRSHLRRTAWWDQRVL